MKKGKGGEGIAELSVNMEIKLHEKLQYETGEEEQVKEDESVFKSSREIRERWCRRIIESERFKITCSG